MSSRERRRLGRDLRGAVYAEFLIAFMPLFIFFMSIVQLAFVEVANIVTKHAAIVATRAAIVVIPDDQNFYDTPPGTASGQRLTDITNAAKIPLQSLDTNPQPTITFGNGTSFAEHDTVNLRLDFPYPCRIPIGNRVVCGIGNATKMLTQYAAMPNQGSRYQYPQ